MFNMFEKVPCVCFKAEFSSAGSAREELTRILRSHLLARFGAVEQGSSFFNPRGQWIEVRLGQRKVWVVSYPRRRKVKEWVLWVGPGDLSSVWDRVLGRKRVAYIEELKVVSRDIHALLGSVTAISNVMWYLNTFRGAGKKGVWTPDELPWEGAR
jgi:hypothetical protein